jgi:hypothetical protein
MCGRHRVHCAGCGGVDDVSEIAAVQPLFSVSQREPMNRGREVAQTPLAAALIISHRLSYAGGGQVAPAIAHRHRLPDTFDDGCLPGVRRG